MSKISKKIVSVGLTFTVMVWLVGTSVPQASGATLEELQAQIAALLAQITALQAQLAQQQGIPAACSFTRSLTVGSKGDDVKCLQQYLNGAGFKVADTGAGSPGNETTYFGPLTKAAVAKWQAANNVSPAVGYFGPISRAKYTELAGVPAVAQCKDTVDNDADTKIDYPADPGCTSADDTTEADAVVGTGLTLSLASDNPAAQTVPKGASSLPFLKFNVSGSGTLDSLTLKRVGIGATGDFESSGINLYDGTTRLTSGKSINSTTHEVSFVNLALAISGIKTLTLVANTTSSATAGNVNAFDLTGAGGTPTPTGFPLTGSGMVIGGATVGTVTVDDGSAPSNPNIGATGALLLTLQVTAGSAEDIEIQRIAMSEGGTVQNEYLTNFKMKYGDQVVATADKVGAKDLITFNFTTPFKIEKGQQKNFDIYADISGASRSSDTIILYVDNSADIVAKGLLYGYTVSPTIVSIDTSSESDTLTLQGANITMNFLGPVTGDIALRGTDVKVFEFNFTSKNNIEIKNFRFSATTTDMDASEGFNDFKLWDAVSNTVLTSATDVTTDTAVTFTDTINVNANQSRTFKITVDVDSDNDTADAIRVLLLPFSSNDIRNLDNNTYVTPSSDITPNAIVIGNAQTVKSPGLDVNLAASPSSRTYVQGTQNAALVGFTFNAVADAIRMTQLKVYATSSTGTLTTAELTNLALYDGDTRLGDLESLDSAMTATFSNFSLTIPKDTTKILTVKGNIATDANNTDVYRVYINALTDITDYDSTGNTVTNTGVTANSGGAVAMTIANVGNATVQADTSDTAGVLIAGSEQLLGNYIFTVTNEDMVLKNVHILVTDSNSATATSTATGDDVPFIRLYDGATLLTGGSSNCVVNSVAYTGCYAVPISGASSSVVQVTNLNWTIGSNSSKTLTIKGLVDKVGFDGQYADSGSEIYASVMAAGFKASGQTTDDTAITAATGQRKVIFKTKPTLSVTSYTGSLQAGDAITAFKFRVAADSAGSIQWKKIQFFVNMTNATMSAVTIGTNGNTQLDNLTTGLSNLSLSTAYSGAQVASDTTATITGGSSGYVTLELTTPQTVSASTYNDYQLKLGFANLAASPGAIASVRLTRQESTLVTGTWYAGITGSIATSGIPSFIWSDYTSSSHATSTGDWTNGGFDGMVKTFGDANTIHN